MGYRCEFSCARRKLITLLKLFFVLSMLVKIFDINLNFLARMHRCRQTLSKIVGQESEKQVDIYREGLLTGIRSFGDYQALCMLSQ